MGSSTLKRALSPTIESNAVYAIKRARSDAQTNEADLQQLMSNAPRPPAHARPTHQLLIFGNGEMGQLGLGTSVLHSFPVPKIHAWFESAIAGGVLGNEEGAGVIRICVGGMHTLVIDELGRVWSWGVNDHGALGRPTAYVSDPDAPDQIIDFEILESQPMLVQKLVDEQFRAVQVAAGDSVSVALNAEGHIRAWGSFRTSDGLLGFDQASDDPTPQIDPASFPALEEDVVVVQVACGSDHVLALTQYGTVYTWGNGQQAQLGRRIIERRKANALTPERLALRRIVYVAAGSYTSYAISEDGIVYAWGLNNYGQTGVELEEEEDTDIVWLPTEVVELNPDNLGKGRRVVKISGGEHHTLFLLNDGSVYGCGRCDSSELGLAPDHPAMLRLVEDAAQSDTSSNASDNHLGMLIATPTLIPFPPPPTVTEPDPFVLPFEVFSQSPPSDPIVHISVGTRNNLAVSRGGHVYSWGVGSVGQLGLGEGVEQQETPARITSGVLNDKTPDGSGWLWKVEDASAGGQHCILLARKGNY